MDLNLNLNCFTVIITPREDDYWATDNGRVYVWSKFQGLYFLGGVGDHVLWYQRQYKARHAIARIMEHGYFSHWVTGAEYRTVWVHRLAGKDLTVWKNK